MMNLRAFRTLPTLLLAVTVTACGVAQPTAAPASAPTAAMMDEGAMAEPTAAMMDDDAMAEPTAAMMDDDAMAEPTAAMMHDDAMAEPTAVMMHDDAMAEPTAVMMRPAWQTLALTNARTGETFTLGDFAGHTVYVEPMATWCHNCREQLTNVISAHEQLGDEAIFIALSVETNVSNAELAQYADEAGFGWTFAVATPELLGALVEAFGRSITNPPTTPHFVIRPDGSATELHTGIDSPDEIVSLIRSES